ncbi:MAG: SUMF1/EgtB/PvdO family nonheme iron enzyme [Gammaproteobacteria bacterium]|nr:SUMF1/EgtB/PvdO family nonheme iron enzyme [Gammaproteobacteria bacterium]
MIFNDCFYNSLLKKKQIPDTKKSFVLIKGVLAALLVVKVAFADNQLKNEVMPSVKPEGYPKQIVTQTNPHPINQAVREEYRARVHDIKALLKQARNKIEQLGPLKDLSEVSMLEKLNNELNHLEVMLTTRNKQKQQQWAQADLIQTLRKQDLAYHERQKKLNQDYESQIKTVQRSEQKAQQEYLHKTKQQQQYRHQLREQQAHEIRNKSRHIADPITGMNFIRVKAGSFMMGSPIHEVDRFNNEILHQVNLTKDYYLGKYEVTQGEWQTIMGRNPSYFKSCGKSCPVDKVSWDEVQEFIRRLNEKSQAMGLLGGYRLPTEAEWEYAARAGTRTPFSFGVNINTSQANFDGKQIYSGAKKGRYRLKTVEAFNLLENAWGFHQMHGNVWEWVSDIYVDYPEQSITDPNVQAGGTRRVSRGGSWDDYAGFCRSAFRGRLKPNSRDNDLGFRLARSTYQQ